MISSLSVKNIALIDTLNVEFAEGLNVVSGETGAGKSILIDSVNFVLGDRADKSLIRYGEDSARVEMVFETGGKVGIAEFFEEFGLDYDPTVIVSRTLTAAGRSDCRINGRPVTLSVLKTLVAKLVDLHGQHENQSLMDVRTHIRFLDNYAEGAKEKLEAFRENFAEYKALKRERAALSNPEERARQIELLEYQRDEIESANLEEDEEDAIAEKRAKFQNMEKILLSVESAASALDGEAGALSIVSAANAALSSVARYDSELDALSDRVESSRIELQDVADELKRYLENADFDQKSMDEVEKRFDLIKSLKRKYGRTVAEIERFCAEVRQTLAQLYGADERAAELDALLFKSEKSLSEKAEILYRIRKSSAERFESEIVRELNDLGMTNTTFSADLTHTENPEEYDANGGDKVEFLISPNKGEPLRPLRKIASGGELSRFMLALKNIVADLDAIDTLIFDEIDTGISGNIAKVVAMKLANIAKFRQVLVVTHLPQIAAMSDRHFLIRKSVKGEKTVTEMRLLDESAIEGEIVRLTGGVEGSETSRRHAGELRAWAVSYKKGI